MSGDTDADGQGASGATVGRPAHVSVRTGRQLSESTVTVTTTRMSLVAGVGEIPDQEVRVLVPFLDCEIYGTETNGEPIWTGRLTLDNVAFILEHAAYEYDDLLVPLGSLLQGELGPPVGRLEYAADRLTGASEKLAEAAARLRAFSARKG